MFVCVKICRKQRLFMTLLLIYNSIVGLFHNLEPRGLVIFLRVIFQHMISIQYEWSHKKTWHILLSRKELILPSLLGQLLFIPQTKVQMSSLQQSHLEPPHKVKFSCQAFLQHHESLHHGTYLCCQFSFMWCLCPLQSSQLHQSRAMYALLFILLAWRLARRKHPSIFNEWVNN